MMLRVRCGMVPVLASLGRLFRPRVHLPGGYETGGLSARELSGRVSVRRA